MGSQSFAVFFRLQRWCSEVLRLAVACLNAKPFVRCAVSRFKLLSSRNSFLITPTPGWDQEEAIRPLAKTRGKRAANRWQSTWLHKGDRPDVADTCTKTMIPFPFPFHFALGNP